MQGAAKLLLSVIVINLIIISSSVVLLLGLPYSYDVNIRVGAGEFLLEEAQRLNIYLTVGYRVDFYVNNSYKNLYVGIKVEGYNFYAVIHPKEEKVVHLLLYKGGEYPIQLLLGNSPTSLHKVADGKIVVGQSYLYIAGVSSVALIATCLPLFLMKKEKFSQQRGRLNASTHEFRYDLLQVGIIRRIVRSRSLQFALIIPNLFILLIIILSGIFGIRLHSLNFSTVFVWIVWLFVLTVIMVPFFSRIWCIMCPLPAYGEWLQRKAFIDKREGKQLSLAKKWPIKLRNFWPITSAFILMSLISNPATFNPQITGYLLLSIVVVITLSFVIFDRRTFCRYICPISCFFGLYSMFSPIEVRVRDPKVCREHLMYENVGLLRVTRKGMVVLGSNISQQ